MKKKVFLWMMLLLLGLALPGRAVFAADFSRQGTVKVTATGGVTVHSGPGSQYEDIGSLKRGKTVSYYNVCGNWLRVNCEDGTGYILKDGCSYKSSSCTEEDNLSRFAGSGWVSSIADGLKIHTAPSGTSQAIAYLHFGDTVRALRTEGSYTAFWYYDTVAWALSEYLVPAVEKMSAELPDFSAAELNVSKHPADFYVTDPEKSQAFFTVEAESTIGTLSYEWESDIPFAELEKAGLAKVYGKNTNTLIFTDFSDSLNGMTVFCKVSNGFSEITTEPVQLLFSQNDGEKTSVNRLSLSLPPTFSEANACTAILPDGLDYKKYELVRAEWIEGPALRLLIHTLPGYEFDPLLSQNDVTIRSKTMALKSTVLEEADSLIIELVPVSDGEKPFVAAGELGAYNQTIVLTEGQQISGLALSAINNTYQALNFGVLSGGLPSGVQLQLDGRFKGAAETGTSGIYHYTIRVSADRGYTAAGMPSHLSSTMILTLVILPAHIHNYSVEETKADCNTQGIRRYSCECGESYTSLVEDALSHDWTEWETSGDICTEETVLSHNCRRCGKEEVFTLAAMGHSDADMDGVCDLCGSELSEEEIEPDAFFLDRGSDEISHLQKWLNEYQSFLVIGGGVFLLIIVLAIMFYIMNHESSSKKKEKKRQKKEKSKLNKADMKALSEAEAVLSELSENDDADIISEVLQKKTESVSGAPSDEDAPVAHRSRARK